MNEDFLVEHTGLEPVTPTLPVLCAPNCANAPRLLYYNMEQSGLQALFCKMLKKIKKDKKSFF